MIDENSVDEGIALQKRGDCYEPGLFFQEASLKQFGYQVMDEVCEYLSTIRERPVWKPMPGSVRETIREQGIALSTAILSRTRLLFSAEM